MRKTMSTSLVTWIMIKVKPLQIMLPKTSEYVKSYDRQNKCVYLLIEDDELSEKKQYYLR